MHVRGKAEGPFSYYREETSVIEEGQVCIVFPDPMSRESAEDIEEWLTHFVRKIKRRAFPLESPTQEARADDRSL